MPSVLSKEDSVETSIRVVLFTGDKRDWVTWEEKFLARAIKKGYKKVLIDSGIGIPKSTDAESTLSDEQKKIRAWNENAYGDLILSMDTQKSGGRVAFNIVRGTKSKDYEDGNARTAWRNLTRKYAPKTAPTMTKLSQMYQNARLREGRDPDVFITHLEDLRTQLETMNWTVTDTQFMVKILNSLTDDYENQMEDLEKRIGKTGSDALTIEDIREELNLRYERLTEKERKSQKKDYGNGSETALFAGGFKGRCHNCGKYGHKAVECKDKNNNTGGASNKGNSNGSGREFKGKCYKCGEKGHMKRDCPKGKDEIAEVALTAMDIGFTGKCFECSEVSHKEEDCLSLMKEDGSNGKFDSAEVALTAIDFGEDLISKEIAEMETARSHEFGETSGPSGLLDDFFDDWSQFGPEDDDNSNEEFALVAFDEPRGYVPEAAVSKLEGTSEEETDEVSVCSCQSLVLKASNRDDDSEESSACPELTPRKWRWGDDDSTDTEDSNNYPKPVLRGSVQGSSVSGSEIGADDIDGNDDWALWNKSGREIQIDTLLMATEANESRDMIGMCRECGDLGIIGNFCVQCKDTGMIYESRNDEETDEDEDDEESEEYDFEEGESTDSIDHLDQLLQVLYVPKGLSRAQRGWLSAQQRIYQCDSVKDFLIQLPIMVSRQERRQEKSC